LAKIETVDIGVVTTIEDIHITNVAPKQLTSVVGTYNQFLVPSRKDWRISGYLSSPTQAEVNSVRNLRNAGIMALLDATDNIANMLAFGKLLEVRFVDEEMEVDRKYYDMIFAEQPALGTTDVQTSEAKLASLDELTYLEMFMPFWGRFVPTFNAGRTTFDYEYWLYNRKASIQTVIIEVQTHDLLSKFKLYYWNGSTYVLIGDWGGADAWDAIKAFTYETIAHDVRTNKGSRGDTLTGIGTISKKLGAKKRVLFSITNMQAADASGSTLRLKTQIEASAAMLKYGWGTYIDASQQNE